jgi:hypothetical protein
VHTNPESLILWQSIPTHAAQPLSDVLMQGSFVLNPKPRNNIMMPQPYGYLNTNACLRLRSVSIFPCRNNREQRFESFLNRVNQNLRFASCDKNIKNKLHDNV